jgi:hypothetical protein
LLVERTADPSATPDFLSNFVALANFMRLSLRKGALKVMKTPSVYQLLAIEAFAVPFVIPSTRISC